ncbi:MAG TPA: chemotaxis protein CheW [Planctomycetota bacterium]|nr:chemotaxis protein CheW [Planctomycetota bacterium]
MSETTVKGTAPRAGATAGKYLTFGLGDEVYGLEILKVQEIIGLMRVTRVPGLPEVIRGVVNLRGKVIPVVDLRKQFGMEAKADTERTCIVVVRVWRENQAVTVGLIVDDVREVLAIVESQLEAVPRFSGGVETAYLLGMAKISQRVVMLLHVDRILSSTQLGALPAPSSEKPATEQDAR